MHKLSKFKVKLICSSCGYRCKRLTIKCPRCGGCVEPVLEDPYWSPGGPGVWRYSCMLPRFSRKLTLMEGSTPVLECEFQGSTLLFKDEGRNPTGSFRDRAAAVIVSHAIEYGAAKICVASDGNMGASVAAYASKAGVEAIVVTPIASEPAKIAQVKAYGARIVYGGSTLDEAVVVAERMSIRRRMYNATAEENPLAIMGLATIAYEVIEDGVEPDYIVVPTASGLTLYSIYYGYKMACEAGVETRVPKLIAAVCSEHSSRIISLYYRNPPILEQALRRAREAGGGVVSVSLSEIRDSVKELATKHGLLVESAAGAAYAAALKIAHEKPGSRILVLLTGNGFKSLSARGVYGSFGLKSMIKQSILVTLLKKEELRGYDLWREIGAGTPQAVYKSLKKLVSEGLVYSRRSNGVVVYGLTRAGRSIAEAIISSMGVL